MNERDRKYHGRLLQMFATVLCAAGLVFAFMGAKTVLHASSIDAASSIEKALSAGFKDGCTVEESQEGILACVWMDGFGEEMETDEGSEGMSARLEAVQALLRTVSSLSQTILASSGLADQTFSLCLLDDRDRETVLLELVNGDPVSNQLGGDAKPQEPGEEEDVPSQGIPAAVSKPEEKEPTMGERNALGQAKDYLDIMSFAYEELIGQLEYDGYTHEEAVYGADHCGADWYEQAARKAQQYLDIMSFSRSGLIDQLLFDGFTQSEAEYAVTAVGY